MSIQNDCFTIMNQQFNLREALDEIVLSYELNLQHCKLALLLNVSKQTPQQIICDKIRLQQIINNLLSNAIKFARSRIYVEVEYIKERDLLQVIVTDDGFGFSFESMGYIMDCMSVSSEIKKYIPKVEGLGMGLQICKSILAKLGGKIIINNGTNTLTSFKIQIPSCLPAK